MKLVQQVAAVAAATILSVGCSSTSLRESPPASSSPPAANAEGKPTAVKSRDGSYTGEVIGSPAPNSKFAKLAIGMNMAEVQQVFGRVPDRSHSYESGKRWIPFYFGNDARRLQALYKGEGCLIFTDGNAWGGSGGDLVQIHVDPTGACYQP